MIIVNGCLCSEQRPTTTGKIQRPTKGKNRDLSVEKLYAGTITSRNTKNGTTKKSIVFRDIEIEPSKD